MKKFISVVLCACMIFCFAACSAPNNDDQNSSSVLSSDSTTNSSVWSSNSTTNSSVWSSNSTTNSSATDSTSSSRYYIPPSNNIGDDVMSLGNVIIFGDSYSTFKGWLPAGYGFSYSENGTDGNEVVDVKDTWWYQVISQTGSNLVMNNSWSGTTIGYTGYNGEDMSPSKSFITRFEKLANEGFFKKNKIDTVFIFGGTNDSWSGAPLGKLRFDNLNKDYCYDVLPAICYLFKTVKETLPDAKIYCLVNTQLNEKITEGMKEAAKHYSIPAIEFDQIDKTNGHPTILGMKQISDGVLKYINK